MLEKFLISIGLKQPSSVEQYVDDSTTTVRPSTENRFVNEEYAGDLRIHEPKDEVEIKVLKTFSEIGPDAHAAINNLLVMLEHDNANYRALSAEALGEIGYPSLHVINALNNLINDKDNNVVKTVEWSLKELMRIKSERNESW